MPIQKRWRKFTLANVKNLSNERGVYELASNNKRIIDIGGSDSPVEGIRGRLLSHLRSNKYPTARYFRVEFAPLLISGISMEALHGRKYVEKHGRKPKDTKALPRKHILF